MKKGVVVVLVLLAAIVLVSPAIVGRLAERSMDESLNWAASESGEVRVTSEHFTRGWFSSDGQHRIELQEGGFLSVLGTLAGPLDADDVPVLIINTRLDHGLIPLTSMSRDRGSLAPGLGSAVSTMQVELPDGEVIEVPGTIYSKIALGGELRSTYLLEAGSHSDDGVVASWGDSTVDIASNPSNGKIEFDGTIGTLAIGGDGDGMTLAGLSFGGQQEPTRFGVSVGDIALAIDDLTVKSGLGPSVGIRTMAVKGNTDVDDGDLDFDATITMTTSNIPPLGESSYDVAVTLTGADAAALGRIQRGLGQTNSSAGPTTMYATIEEDARQLFASGFELNIEKLNVTLPQGTVSSQMQFAFGEEDPATFGWMSLLLSTEASVDVSIPDAVMDLIAQANPQAALAVGGGYLVKRGDAYVMKAELKKGLLTVNGAPIPIPLGAVR